MFLFLDAIQSYVTVIDPRNAPLTSDGGVIQCGGFPLCLFSCRFSVTEAAVYIINELCEYFSDKFRRLMQLRTVTHGASAQI